MSDLRKKQKELLQKVNSIKNADIVGIEELEDFVDLYYEVCEELEKDSDNKPGIFTMLKELGKPFVVAYDGFKVAWMEAHYLEDEEISSLVKRSSNFNLGDNAVRYSQVLKLVLVGFQTYAEFTK